jgi:hypothetical protein
MPDAPFESLRLELLRSGVSPVYADRTVLELAEHYADLESAALSSGSSVEEARRLARASLGTEQCIAAAIMAQPGLLTFTTRHPRFAQCLHSAATIGSLPGVPLIFCIEHRPELARWGAAISVAAMLMGSVLAALNWLIVLPFQAP